MKDMIGYCGLDCEKCDAYIATVNEDWALREKTAKLWAELNNAPILPEHINCEGCRANGADGPRGGPSCRDVHPDSCSSPDSRVHPFSRSDGWRSLR